LFELLSGVRELVFVPRGLGSYFLGLPRTYVRAIVCRPFRDWDWVGRSASFPAESIRVYAVALRQLRHELYFGAESTSGHEVKILDQAVVGTPLCAGGAACWRGVLRRAKNALLRRTGLLKCGQFPAAAAFLQAL
jgi:hypothetical protein